MNHECNIVTVSEILYLYLYVSVYVTAVCDVTVCAHAAFPWSVCGVRHRVCVCVACVCVALCDLLSQ